MTFVVLLVFALLVLMFAGALQLWHRTIAAGLRAIEPCTAETAPAHDA